MNCEWCESNGYRIKHERFHYKTPEEIKEKAEELQVHLPFAKDTHVLTEEVSFGNVTLKNRILKYQKLTAAVKEAGIKANGFAPYLVMQANHSVRYSNPQGKPAPLIAYRHPEYEKLRPADDSCIVLTR